MECAGAGPQSEIRFSEYNSVDVLASGSGEEQAKLNRDFEIQRLQAKAFSAHEKHASGIQDAENAGSGRNENKLWTARRSARRFSPQKRASTCVRAILSSAGSIAR